MTVEATPLATAAENLVSLADIKAHCRIDDDASNGLLAKYQSAVVAEILLMTDNPMLFTTALTDQADLNALHVLQMLLIADMFDRRYSTTPVEVRWTQHAAALADKFRKFRRLHGSC